MSFIIKDSPITLNIKLTTLGRKKLSEGNLQFKKWAIGDSEINYEFASETSFDLTDGMVLRPKDVNPSIKSYIKENPDSESNYTTISSVDSTEITVINTASERGFFLRSGSTFTLDLDQTRQPHLLIRNHQLNTTGKTTLSLVQSSAYGLVLNEPQVNDFILIGWRNPRLTGTSLLQNSIIDINSPIPFIWYKIQDIISGTSIALNNLQITVDKNLPNFNGISGTSFAIVYPNASGYTSTNTSEYDSMKNYYDNVGDVRVWNMSIIYGDTLAGTLANYKNKSTYKTKKYSGDIVYIAQSAYTENSFATYGTTLRNVGIIHYTNSSITNNYGESLDSNTPVLDLPTIMWHYNTGNTLGLTLSCGNERKTLNGLDSYYYDLGDEDGNVVGKCFIDLKIFVIEDQELLHAMSYKSNRNWTIPECSAGFNISTCVNPCSIEFDYINVTQPTVITGGTIEIIASGYSGTIYYSNDNGVTYQTSNIFYNVSAGNYMIRIKDITKDGCVATALVTLTTDAADFSIDFSDDFG
jgi:hypothetical protein